MLRVLYDGWPVVYQPGSSAALHLLTILTGLPPRIEALVALPGRPPAWFPNRAEPLAAAATDTPASRLKWEQRTLPELCRKTGAHLLHLTTPVRAAFSSLPTLLSPTASGDAARTPGFAGRLRQALGAGGYARLRGLLWPADLDPEGADPVPVFNLPPVLEPAGLPAGDGMDWAQTLEFELPETYLLYHGRCDTQALAGLLDAWSWAAGPVGHDYPLLVSGLDRGARQDLAEMASLRRLEDTLRPLPELAPQALAGLLQGCTAFFHPARPAPWGSLLRLALAFGRPVVGGDDQWTAALVGPAAYLAKADDPRALGAALITLIVEPQMAEIPRAGRASTRCRLAGWKLCRRAGDSLPGSHRHRLSAGCHFLSRRLANTARPAPLKSSRPPRIPSSGDLPRLSVGSSDSAAVNEFTWAPKSR